MVNREYEIPVDQVRDFGRRFLWNDTASFAIKILTKDLRWHAARASVVVRSSVSDADAVNFVFGGKVSASDANDWLVDNLNECLIGNKRFVLVEDWTLEKGDGIIEKYSYPAVYYGKDVFFVIERRSSNFELAYLNISPRFIGFVIDGPAPEIGVDLSESTLEKMSKRVSLVYFGAYDGEGYVVVTFGS